MKIRFERWSRNALARLLGIFAPAHKMDPRAVAKLLAAPHSKVLILRPHQGLGDLLLATPALRALKAAYPAVKVHFLADTYNVVAIQDNPRLDKVWVWDKDRMKNPFQLWRFLRALRAERFTIALPLSSHVPSFTSYFLARTSGAKAVWAYDSSPFYGEAVWSRHLANVELKNRPENDPEWVKFMELFRPLIGASRPEDFTPEFTLKPENETWAQDIWRKIQLPPARKKVGLFFGGNPDRPERLWPPDYWGELAVKLQKNEGMSLLAIVPPEDFLSGSRALEKGIYPQIVHRLLESPPVFADKDLARVAAFLKGLDLFVCVDGGLFHIAVASGVPTLGLFFKTDPARWKPPVPWATVLRPLDDDPRSLSPEEVYQQICELVVKSKLTNAL